MTTTKALRNRTHRLALSLLVFCWSLALSLRAAEPTTTDSITFHLLTRRMPEDLKQRYREAIAQDPTLRRAIFGQMPTARPSAVKTAAPNTDLNNDGITNASDVQLAVDQSRGR